MKILYKNIDQSLLFNTETEFRTNAGWEENFLDYQDQILKTIINPIENYKEYTIENIKKHTKPECLIIKIPYIRFDGFWLESEYITLKKFKSDTVKDFPNIRIDTLDDYLDNTPSDSKLVEEHFNNCIIKLKKIQENSDILFVDFIIENYKLYPLFKDSNHPTILLLNYISQQLVSILCDKYQLKNTFIFSIKRDIKLSGHFKPITNSMKKILGIEYDLDTYYKIPRKEYLLKILEYENSDNNPINNYEEFYRILFNT